ncbi:glycosyl hydrolase [Mucilaginibacter celer]|uniref:Asl1-like glycosyl hydrolase catalytic domain-containing protein n=1 Tax=Mucilaginibacter celer TaxID=2305508 RepID=A0A494VL64_9SPHI|nr:glycosyl hydrolase [Mucilaginibacter celer]AYL95244.1 hypothetical protein HYN43_008035 [Mucilaginibacter celer]
MTKTIYKLVVAILVAAGFSLMSCSKKDDAVAMPAPALPDSLITQSFAATSSSKISLSGSNLELGVVGHPMGDAPYVQTPATKQISLIKGMGMTWYRVGFQTRSDGTISVPWLWEPLQAAAKAGGIKLLPMLYTRTLDLEASQSESYQAGKKLGADFAAKYGQYFTYYDLGNDLELKVLLPKTTGQSQADYDRKKFNVIAAYLKGMDEGIKSKDSDAKTMVSAGWLHYGFIRMLDWYGVNFDVVAYHWYSEMENIAPKAPYNIPDITQKLSSLFPNKPIWITEFNLRYKDVNTHETDQNKFISSFIAKCKANPQVKVAIIYELFNEPHKSSELEANYGIIKWATPYTSWVKKLVAKNLTL